MLNFRKDDKVDFKTAEHNQKHGLINFMAVWEANRKCFSNHYNNNS